MVVAGGEVITAARAMGSGCRRCCALREGGACRVDVTPGVRVDRGECYLLQTHLAREDAIKAAPAMENDHCAHCARRRW
jgi:hypothetical protein